jgi:hypothetical protein
MFVKMMCSDRACKSKDAQQPHSAWLHRNMCRPYQAFQDGFCVLDVVQVLPQLLYSHDPMVLLFASLAVYHLAALPHMKDPLGDAGAVAALVSGVRRWVGGWA